MIIQRNYPRLNPCNFNRIALIVFIILLAANTHADDYDETIEETSEEKYDLPREHGETSPAKSLRVRILDSQTGYAVYPEEIIIIDTYTKKTVFYHRTYDRNAAMMEFKGGIFPLWPELPPGFYKYIILSKGYEPLTSAFLIDESHSPGETRDSTGTQPISIEFYLNPVENPPEFERDALAKLKRKDSDTLVGFIVDEETGRPLENATIRTIDGRITTVSNTRGFFAIPLSLQSGKNKLRNVRVIFEKKGYCPEVRDNQALQSYGVRKARVLLKPSKG